MSKKELSAAEKTARYFMDETNIKFHNYLKSTHALEHIYIKQDIYTTMMKAKKGVILSLQQDHEVMKLLDTFLDDKIKQYIEGMDAIWLSWERYGLYVRMLRKKIAEQNKKYKFLYGIPRGGTLLALMLSYQTGIPVIFDTKGVPKEDICIIDDIVDSGKTLKYYIEDGYDTITMFKHKDCEFEVTAYLSLSDMWINFPYEVVGKDVLSTVNKDNIKERREDV